jgi:hypothetical protein
MVVTGSLRDCIFQSLQMIHALAWLPSVYVIDFTAQDFVNIATEARCYVLLKVS